MCIRDRRTVLGTHVEQAGSYVDAARLRFDFTHFSALTPEEIKNVEDIVNKAIADALPVKVENLPIEEAKKTGAQALFGEKYGDIVRVVSMGEFSKEMCIRDSRKVMWRARLRRRISAT